MRKKIPKITKEIVSRRQGGRCVCCIEVGKEYHHVKPVSLGGSNNYKNIVLLCEEHHKLVHLGDIETIQQVLEYLYFIENGKLPDDFSLILEQADKVKKEKEK